MRIDSRSRIAHLLRRAAFGARPDEVEQYAARGLEATVEQLIDYENVLENPAVRDVPSRQNNGQAQPYDLREIGIAQLTAWWLESMVYTSRPLRDKLALFWHDFFATSNAKVENPKYLYWQLKLLRDQATGNFRDLLKGINRDPAMIVWLDSKDNVKASPNENYARELFELFSLGFENFQRGAYIEADVQQAARAFTGWRLKPDPRNLGQPANGEITDPTLLIDIPGSPSATTTANNNHDFGTKTVFGVTGNFNGDDIIDLILDHEPQRTFAAQYLGKRLWEYFAYENPEPALVEHLGAVVKRHDFSIKAILRDMFLGTKEFYSERAMFSLAKWPPHLIVGAHRLLQTPLPAFTGIIPLTELIGMMNLMGQTLFMPPDVFGWESGVGWFSTARMLARANWSYNLVAGRYIENGISLDRVLPTSGLGAAAAAEEVTEYFGKLLIQRPLTPAVRQSLIDYLNTGEDGAVGTYTLGGDVGRSGYYKKTRGLIRLLLSRPECQSF